MLVSVRGSLALINSFRSGKNVISRKKHHNQSGTEATKPIVIEIEGFRAMRGRDRPDS